MKRFFLVLLLIFFTLSVLAFLWYQIQIQGLNPTDTAKQEFVVYAGDNLFQIGTRLQQNNLIKNTWAFMLTARIQGKQTKIQAGNFTLSPSYSSPEIIKILTTSGSKDISVRLPEGGRSEEYAKILASKLDFSPAEFLSLARLGYVFPDTYLVATDSSVSDFLSQTANNFEKKFTQALATKTSTLTNADLVILASLIEREGRSLEDKKIISGILHNRLQQGMALQVDASVQFVRDSRQRNILRYWEPISKLDLKLPSPYNTYLNPGLPPQPICNPSLESLQAAAAPTSSNYLFYMHDTSGTPHYASTISEHNQNVAKYLR